MADPENTKSSYNSAIPFNWEAKRLGTLVEILSGVSPSVFDLEEIGKYPFVKVEDLNNCEKYQLTSRNYSNTARFLVPKYSVVFPKRGAAILNNKVRINSVPIQMDSNLMAIHPTSSSLLTEYLYYRIIFEKLHKIADTSTIPQINNKHITPYMFPLPPVPEQKAIANVLGLVDQAIELNGKIIAQKELRKKWLMQNLLTGQKRLKGFTDEWETLKLGDVATESETRNGRSLGADSLMAVTKSFGIVPMRERVQGESVARCKTIERNYFAYNPMRLNIGSIARWKGDRRAMVSGDYVVFRCNADELDPDYLDHFRRTHRWSSFVRRAGDGSVRVRIYFSHLRHLKFQLPKIEEQKAISRVLNAAAEEIELLSSRVSRIQELKRGLMQQLLTGKKRLRIENV